MKKRLALDQSLYTILQVLSITLFEKTLISRALAENDYNNKFTSGYIQLNLFDSQPDTNEAKSIIINTEHYQYHYSYVIIFRPREVNETPC